MPAASGLRCVRLAWPGATSALPAWRLASLELPPVSGLVARHWLVERHEVQAQYVFDGSSSAIDAFLADPGADPDWRHLHAAFAMRRPAVEPLARRAALDRPIFVIAAPRSGSTLLFDLLSRAPDVWSGNGEGAPAIDGVRALHPAARGWDSDRIDDAHATGPNVCCLRAGWRFGLRDRDGRPWSAVDGPGPRLLDKTTENSLRVALLASACPDARFVFLHRDARPSVSSLMKAWQHGGFVRFGALPGWADPWCFLLPPDWRALRGRPLQEIATAQWDAANRWALHDLEALPRDRWTAVDYHELIARPRATVHRLCRFLDLSVDAAFDAYLRRPLAISATAIEPPSSIKWRSHADLDPARVETRVRVTSARLRDLSAIPAAAPTSGDASSVNSVGRRTTRLTTTDAGPAARYACRLADLMPFAASSGPDEATYASPSWHLQAGASIPLGLAGATRFRERFVTDVPIVWSRDRTTRAWQPWWAERGDLPRLRTIAGGKRLPPLPAALAGRLHAAGLIETAAERQTRAAHAEAWAAACAHEFATHGYAVLRSVLPAAVARSLGAYYDALASIGWAFGDAQVARRLGRHNEALARFFHHQYATLIATIAGEPVCPSYCYVSAYQSGAELDPHVDRKQCEFTVSMVYAESGGRSGDWPLWFLAGAAPSSVTLEVGDAVVFRGHDLVHWRDAAPVPGMALSTLLFHYVPVTFRETLH
ncbi:MAG: sulfotransferase [Proteobacteria bacterium]|nr:sulfotransferase [Pseudomonadota bacterium]